MYDARTARNVHLWQGVELVEERLDECGVDGDEEKGDAHHKRKQVGGHVGARHDEDVGDALHEKREIWRCELKWTWPCALRFVQCSITA